MAYTYAIVNQKGGVGKTTTAVNLAAGLGIAGKKVLLVDMDPQGNATTGVGTDKSLLEFCIYNVLVDDVPAEKAIIQTKEKNLYLLPATLDLAGADVELMPKLSREHKLKIALAPIEKDYDFIIIDCPPSLGLLTLNVLVATTYLILPIQCEFYAMEGLAQLLQTIDLVKKSLNSNLEIGKVLCTMFDYRTNLSEDIYHEVKDFFKDTCARVIVPRNVKLAEAPEFGKSIYLYNSESKGAQIYGAFTMEVLEHAQSK